MQTLDFGAFLADAWDRHAAEPEAVAARLAGEGPGLAGTGPQDGQDRPWSASYRIRIAALAAATLADRDTPRALALFDAALAEAGHTQPPADDPVHRALAVTGNILASALEELPQRSRRSAS